MKNITISIIASGLLFSACSKSGKTPTPTISTLLSSAFPGIDTASFYEADPSISAGNILLLKANPPVKISASAGTISIPAASNWQDTVTAFTYNFVISDTAKATSSSGDWWYYSDIRKPSIDTLIVNATIGYTKSGGKTYYRLNVGGAIRHVIQEKVYYAIW